VPDGRERFLDLATAGRLIPPGVQRVRVVPGLTGLAQLNWQYGASFDDAARKLVFDLYYVSHCSLSLDLVIMGRTVLRLLAGKGAR
jgi:lipopolysaccharide/colanic/teichoic acid biosynthesis glycosyltransferase